MAAITISLLEKCKSKLQWDITSHWSQWPSSKNLQTINAREGMKKREPSCTIGGNANWDSHYGRQHGDPFKKLGMKLRYAPNNPTTGHIPEKTRIANDTYIPMFIAALFTIARTWKQPRCPLIDEWIKKLWHIYTMEFYSARKRIASDSVLMMWMKIEPAEWSTSEREK